MKISAINCKLGLHRYQTARNCVSHSYRRCSCCGKRKISIHLNGGHFPVDQGWVKTGVWTESKPPRIAQTARSLRLPVHLSSRR